MRILVVAESFLPHMNGVTNSVLRVVDHFAASGDDLGIIAPKWPGADKHLRTSCGRSVRVRRIASAPMPGYTEVRIALSLIHISEPTRRLRGSRMPSSA